MCSGYLLSCAGLLLNLRLGDGEFDDLVDRVRDGISDLIDSLNEQINTETSEW